MVKTPRDGRIGSWTLHSWRLLASTPTSFTSTTVRSASRRAVAVRRAAAAWRERAERNPHRFNRVEVAGLIAAAREGAAAFLGIDPSRAAWVRNVSEGVSAVLGSLTLRPGDELVIGTHGYGAVRKALNHHAARSAARVVEASFPVGAEDDVIVSAYAAACSSRTRLVVVDRITSPTATVVPSRP